MKKHFLSLLISIAIIIIVLLIYSCENLEKTDADTQNIKQKTDIHKTVEYSPNIETVDYNGSEFTIVTRSCDNYCRQLDDISAENINGNILNDEIYERNNKIIEKYNVTFNIITNTSPTGLIQKSYRAGDDEYDIVLNSLNENIALSSQGCYANLDELPHVDISQSYWSNDITNDISIFNKYYVGVSDLTIQAYFSSGIVYFNKQLAEEYQLENPYNLATSGEWTLDKMLGLCRNVSSDLNGNNQWDEKDQYGLTFNNFAWQIMFYGIGETFVNKNEQGELFFDFNNGKIINSIQMMMPISLDEKTTLYSENYGHIGGEYRVDVCKNAFNEGRILFWLEAMYGVPSLREMERDFGILPVPKYDENQSSYYSFIHSSHASSVAVPVLVSDKDRVGRILEDLTYLSSITARNAFIETTLKGKYSRDNESADMIDIVIGNIRTDYALLLNSSGLTIDGDIRALMNKGSTDINSLFTSKGQTYSKILDVYNNAMKEVS